MFDEQKPSEHELADELVALERQLKRLTTATPRIDRDRLMFAAGQAAEQARSGGHAAAHSILASTRRVSFVRGKFWPIATATMTAATLLLATMLVWQQRAHTVAQSAAEPQEVVELVRAPREVDANGIDRYAQGKRWSMAPSATSGYLNVRYIALTRGVGDLPLDPQSMGGNVDLPEDNYRTEPATVRGLREELLPASQRSLQSRS